MTISATGGIWQGTGTFAAPTNGLKIWNSGGQGRVATFSGGQPQVSLRYDRGIEFVGSNVASPSALTFAQSSGGTIFGRLVAYTAGGSSISKLYITDGANEAGVELETTAAGEAAALFGGTTRLTLSNTNDYALLSNADLYVRESGIAVGYTTTPALNRGQIASDFAGAHDFNALVLQDTTDVAHGMTTVVGTATYGALGKEVDADGGLKIIGASQGVIGTRLYGYGTGESTASTTAARAAVVLSGRKASGTGSATIGNTGNILTVDNNGTTRLIVKGNGDLLIDGTQSSYDEYDDVALLRAADLAQAGHDIDAGYGDWLAYNRADLEAAGLLDGTFVNVTRMQRLITGAIGQLAGRVKQLEETRG